MTTPTEVSRRRLLGVAGAGVLSAGVGGAVGFRVGQRSDSEAPVDGALAYEVVDFHGDHQAGITTAAQDRLHFAAFDLTTDSRDDVIELLKAWSDAAEKLTEGQPAGTYGAINGPMDAPPEDTGEAQGLAPSRLTVTIGFGPTLFETPDGKDRFGIADKRPELLKELPHFPADQLIAEKTGGDLCVQACADDPQVAVHAIRNLARIAFGTASVKWSQLGFGRTSSTSVSQDTPRNLFGFKDGTANIKAEESDELDKHVWVQTGDDPKAQWLNGGSYLVARRINMHIETWDRESLRGQETIIGRDKGAGAPLSGGDEFAEPDFEIKGDDGTPKVDPLSHVAMAHPVNNDGVRILRRGYNFTDGSDGLGRLDAGLFFIAYMRDPAKQYIPMQTALARDDLLSEYLKHTGSALFAVPPGVKRPGGYVGESLFGS